MSWYETFKDVTDILEKVKSAEAQKARADLMLEGAKLIEENANLRLENQQLREQLALKDEMVFKDNLYWRRKTEGEEDGPYCPNCLDGSSKPVRMTTQKDPKEGGFYACPVSNFFESFKQHPSHV
jgi:regulator of replication initiation timing